MPTKSAHATINVKADGAEGGDEGVFEAIVSAFGNIDSYGERVVKGAFAETLAEWDERGDPIPVLWSHQSGDPQAHIGKVLEAEERDAGLWVKGQLDIDADPLESHARQVWRMLKGRRVTQFSFAYDVLDAAPVTEDGETVLDLKRLKLYEVGPTLIGVNQETELLGTKALAAITAQLKAGRVLSAKNFARLEEAYDAIGAVLAAAKPSDDDDGKSQRGDRKRADEASDAGKSDEHPIAGPATTRLLTELRAFELV